MKTHKQHSLAVRITQSLLIVVLIIACGNSTSAGDILGSTITTDLPNDPKGTVMLKEAQRKIVELNSKVKRESNVIRLVYFHPNDREPLNNWNERLVRTVNDVSDFYKDGLSRLGVSTAGLPFERDKAGHPVFHVVQGRQGASAYNYGSGAAILAEIKTKLSDKIDFNNEHLLSLNGLCHQEDNGKYVFNSPYYGKGNQISGYGHAADCDLLDPNLLTDVKHNIVYKEHYYEKIEQTVALFNSWYIGGIAHELGHGIGLPHGAGRPLEQSWSGVSLMSNGNLHYREELWGGENPAFLSLATALRLISHPLITQSNRLRFKNLNTNLDKINFSYGNRSINLTGLVRSEIPAYAVVAYLWSPKQWPGNGLYDHNSATFPALINDEGRFKLQADNLTPGDYRLRLSVLYLNGASSNTDYHLVVNQEGPTEIVRSCNVNIKLMPPIRAYLNGKQKEAADLARKLLADFYNTLTTTMLNHLIYLASPQKLRNLDQVVENSIYLSEVNTKRDSVGWGQLTRDKFYDKYIKDVVFLNLGGKLYTKGLYAHSPSIIEFALNEKWQTFSSVVGLQQHSKNGHKVKFIIKGDGNILYESKLLNRPETEHISVDVSGISKLELIVKNADQGNVYSWSVWGEPQLKRNE